MSEKLTPISRALVAAAKMPAPQARRILMLICESGMTMDVPQPTPGELHYSKREKFIKRMKSSCDRVLNYARHETLRKIEKHFRDGALMSGDLPGHPFHGNQWTKVHLQQIRNEVDKAIAEKKEWAMDVKRSQNLKYRRRDSIRFSVRPNPNPSIDKPVFSVDALTNDMGIRNFDANINTTYDTKEEFLSAIARAKKREIESIRGSDGLKPNQTLCEVFAAEDFRETSVIQSAESGDSPTPKPASSLAVRLTFDKELLSSELLAALAEDQQAALSTAGQQLFDEIGKDSVWRLPSQDAIQFVQDRANLLANVPDEIHREIMDSIEQGLQQGESRKELMARISAAFDEIGKSRAETIANTETAAAFNYSRDKAMREAGVTHKRWLHSMSPLIKEPRPTHLEANGQTRPIDDPFDVGGVQFMRPADDSLGAGPEDIINCHCVAIAVETPIESSEGEGHPFHGNQWTGGIGGHKTASEISGVTPKDAPLKTFTAYHVTKRENAESILKNGFDLSKVKPRWVNDYAVSLSRGRKAATAYFTSRGQTFNKDKYALLQVSGKGRLFSDPGGFNSPVGSGVASDARDYTRRMIGYGYDGHDLGGTIYVHNPKSLTNIREISPE